MSSKDPAFLFYPKDWLQGTAKLFHAEKGVYIDLLAHHHQDGFLPIDVKRLAKICGITQVEFEEIWTVLKDKFYEEGGKLFNKKLLTVTSERTEHGEMKGIIGTFGQMMKVLNCPEERKIAIRKRFNYQEFTGIPKHLVSICLSTWLSNCLTDTQANVADAIAIAIGDINTINKEGVPGETINPEMWTEILNRIKKDYIWQEDFCRKKEISATDMDTRLTEFLSDIDLAQDYKVIKELKSHFLHWHNKKYNGKSGNGSFGATGTQTNRKTHTGKYEPSGKGGY